MAENPTPAQADQSPEVEAHATPGGTNGAAEGAPEVVARRAEIDDPWCDIFTPHDAA
jgi:hypothetical protein